MKKFLTVLKFFSNQYVLKLQNCYFSKLKYNN